MSPTHVSVLQCGGSCHRSNHGCIAKKIQIKTVSVMLGKCGIERGKCDKECADVEVEEHTECDCACSLPESKCKSDIQEYNHDRCKCECKDIIGKRECLNQGKLWNENTCMCGCPAVFSCSVGTKYSNNTCACEVIEDQLEISQIEDNRIPRSNSFVKITWEVVIIGILCGIILILLMIIYLLLAKLRRLKSLLIKGKVGDLNKSKYDDQSISYLNKSEYNEEDQSRELDKSVIRREKKSKDIEETSISSGFVSEVSKGDLQNIEELYVTAEIVNFKRPCDQQHLVSNELHFSRAMHSIDETLKLLKDTADTM